MGVPPGQVWPPFCTVHKVTWAPPPQCKYELQVTSPIEYVVDGMSVQASRVPQAAKSSGTATKPFDVLPVYGTSVSAVQWKWMTGIGRDGGQGGTPGTPATGAMAPKPAASAQA